MSRTQRTARILLIEDTEDVRLTLADVLHDAKYAVDNAGTVAEASAYLDGGSSSYDLVLTDARLPDGHGFMIAEKADLRGIKVLVYTGYARDFPPELLARYTVLEKPLPIADLLDAIGWAIGS